MQPRLHTSDSNPWGLRVAISLHEKWKPCNVFFQEWNPVFSLKTQDGYNKIFVIDGIKYIKVILVSRM